MLDFQYFKEVLEDNFPDIQSSNLYDHNSLAGNILVAYLQKIFLADDDYEYHKRHAKRPTVNPKAVPDGGFAYQMLNARSSKSVPIVELCHYINGICQAGRLIGIDNAIAAAEKLQNDLETVKAFGIDEARNDIVEKPLNSKNMAITLAAIYRKILLSGLTQDTPPNAIDDLRRIAIDLGTAVTIESTKSAPQVETGNIATATSPTAKSGAPKPLNFQLLKQALMICIEKQPEKLWLAVYNEKELIADLTSRYKKTATLDNTGKNIITAICFAGRLIGVGFALAEIESILNESTLPTIISNPASTATIIVAYYREYGAFISEDEDERAEYLDSLASEIQDAINIKYSTPTLSNLIETIAYRFENPDPSGLMRAFDRMKLLSSFGDVFLSDSDDSYIARERSTSSSSATKKNN